MLTRLVVTVLLLGGCTSTPTQVPGPAATPSAATPSATTTRPSPTFIAAVYDGKDFQMGMPDGTTILARDKPVGDGSEVITRLQYSLTRPGASSADFVVTVSIGDMKDLSQVAYMAKQLDLVKAPRPEGRSFQFHNRNFLLQRPANAKTPQAVTVLPTAMC